ncbi:MAG: hypothetical protein WDN26_21850 [Chitinophagaceae bacterium]
MSFVRRIRTKTVLYLRNLETAEEWPIYDKLSKDQQEAWTVFGIYTGYAWTPDDKQIVIWSNGKIIKVDVNGVNKSTEIPFTCNVKQRIYDAPRFQQEINPDTFNVNVIRQAITSPDGKWLVFSAIGHLWKKELPAGKPQRITTAIDYEFEPSFSADGKTLLYITWNDTTSGGLWKVNMVGVAKPVKINRQKRFTACPLFLPMANGSYFAKKAAAMY